MSTRDRFDKFTERARKVLSLAQEEAQRFQHNYIGTEHLLLGLVRLNEGVAVEVLHDLGVEPSKVRAAVEFIIQRKERIVLGEIGLTPRAKKVIELAVDEARRLNHHYIGTEHILLGLIGEGEGIAAGVLASMGVNLEQARTETIRILSGESNAPGISEEAPATIEQEVRPFDQPVARQAGREGKFDKFTERARKVLSLAQEEAQRFQHNYIGTEHLLLGLVREGEGVAAKVLSNLGVELNTVRNTVEFIIGRGDRVVLGEIGLTPRAKKVVELAIDEARRLHHHYIGTEHLLLGLVREGEGIAAGVLESLGVNLEKVRTQTAIVLSQVSNMRTVDKGDATPEQQSETQVDTPQLSTSFTQMRSRLRSDRDRLEKFTERARNVLSMAQEEAQRLRHNYIGTEHILLGIVREQEGDAAGILRNFAVDIDKARNAVEFIIGRGDRIVLGEIDLTPRAKQVIEFAIDAAQRLDQTSVNPEHILLGIIRQGDGIAIGVLESLGVNLEQVRTETLKVLKQENV